MRGNFTKNLIRNAELFGGELKAAITALTNASTFNKLLDFAVPNNENLFKSH